MSATDARREHLVRDVKIPNSRGAAAGQLGERLRQVVELLEGFPRDAEAASDGGEVAVAEDRAFFWQALGAEFVDLRPVGAVVDDDDEDVELVALDGLELLYVHHQAAIAVEEDDALVRARGRDAHGEGDAVADRAEFADRHELLLRAR